MTIDILAGIYIAGTFLLLNSAWVKQTSLTFFVCKKKTFLGFFADWSIRLSAVLYSGYMLDLNYTDAPNQFFLDWQIYTTFIIACATFSMPGFIYFYATRNK